MLCALSTAISVADKPGLTPSAALSRLDANEYVSSVCEGMGAAASNGGSVLT